MQEASRNTRVVVISGGGTGIGRAMAEGFAQQLDQVVILGRHENSLRSTAERVIATVLFLALDLTWVRPAWTRWVAVVGQAFALLGTLVGILMIAVGIGPRTLPNLAYHRGIVLVLVWGLYVAARTPSHAAGRQA